MDSVDVIDIHGEFVLSEKGLRNQILDGLAGDKVIHSVREKGLPTIKWKKSLPTGQFYGKSYCSQLIGIFWSSGAL